MNNNDEPLIELEEVRLRLGIKDINVVRRECRLGKLRAYKLGKAYKTKWSWVDDYLASRLVSQETVE